MPTLVHAYAARQAYPEVRNKTKCNVCIQSIIYKWMQAKCEYVGGGELGVVMVVWRVLFPVYVAATMHTFTSETTTHETTHAHVYTNNKQ